MLVSSFESILTVTCNSFEGKDCTDERDFQRKFIQKLQKYDCIEKCFSIETEGTYSGFPDCLVLFKKEGEHLNNCALIEFKCIRKGSSKFRPMQLPFKEKHKNYVVAYSKDTKKAYVHGVMPGTEIKDGKIYEVHDCEHRSIQQRTDSTRSNRLLQKKTKL